MSIRPFLIIGLIAAIVSCNQNIKKEPQAPQNQSRFIDPPNEKWDVPYKEYSVEAAKGDTIFYESGSILEFPANAFVDKQGKVVTGKVQVKYREFSTPIDFYLAGIPMQYDSAGKNYLFSSSAMCEVYAYKDGERVFVNPAAKPVFNIATDNDEPGHSLYYLDTVQRNWVYEGANKIMHIAPANDDSAVSRIVDEISINIDPPVKPQEANDKTPVIRIEIDTASMKEFMGYNNLKFQLEPGQQFNAADTLQEWTNVELQKGSSKGLYVVKFSNKKKSVVYKARPVFESKDYKAALKEFDKKNKEYQSKIATRKKIEAAQKKKYKVDSLRNAKTLAENGEIERLNAMIAKRNKAMNNDRFHNLFRSFSINRWGAWNCDKSALPNTQSITPVFADSKGNELKLEALGVLYKRIYGYQRSFNNETILLDKDGGNMVVGLVNGRFAYFTYDKYDELLKSKNGVIEEKPVLTMEILSDKDCNYEYIKSIASPVQQAINSQGR
jgi:hypothetical protein